MLRVDAIVEDCTKYGVKIKTEKYHQNGIYPIIDQGQEQIAGYTDDKEGLFENVPVIIFGDHTRIVKYVDTPFFLGADGVKVLRAKDQNANYKYLYYLLKNVQIPNTGYNRHFKWLKEAEIDYCEDIQVQQQIVSQLDKVQSIIDARKEELKLLDHLVKSRFIEMFGIPEIGQTRWAEYKLQSLIDMGWIKYHLDGNHGGDYPRANEFVESGVPYISANCVLDGKIDFTKAKYVTEERSKKFRKGIAKNKDVLFAHNATVGPVAILETKEPRVILGTSLTSYRCNSDYILPEYLKVYLECPRFVRQYEAEMQQSTRKQVPITTQRKYTIVVPEIEMQKAISAFIEQSDKSKQSIQQNIEQLETLKASLMQKYFG